MLQRSTTIVPTLLAVLFFGASARAEEPAERFIRGDANGDARHDISDAIEVLRWLFGGDRAVECPKSADANDDGNVDISDPVSLLGFLFLGQSAPPLPFPRCGLDAR